MLVAAGHRTVSTDRFLEELWSGEPPPSATGALQAYVSRLRSALEPHREKRRPAAVLVSNPPGYALALPDEAVDTWHFASLVRRASGLGDEETLIVLDEALTLWGDGPFAEYLDQEWAATVAARLAEQHAGAVEASGPRWLCAWGEAQALCRISRSTCASTRCASRRSPSWRAATTSPGVRPRRSRRWPPCASGWWTSWVSTRARSCASSSPTSSTRRPTSQHRPARCQPSLRPHPSPTSCPTGRRWSGARTSSPRLAAAADSLRSRAGVVWVEGDAGFGKSALVSGFADQSVARWSVVRGHCSEVAGTPSSHAWREVLSGLGAPAPADTHPFALADAVRHCLEERGTRTMLVLEDVHRADDETLQVLWHLVESVSAPVLVVATFRSHDVGRDLTATLALTTERTLDRVVLVGLDERAAREPPGAARRRSAAGARARAVARPRGRQPVVPAAVGPAGRVGREWAPSTRSRSRSATSCCAGSSVSRDRPSTRCRGLRCSVATSTSISSWLSSRSGVTPTRTRSPTIRRRPGRGAPRQPATLRAALHPRADPRHLLRPPRTAATHAAAPRGADDVPVAGAAGPGRGDRPPRRREPDRRSAAEAVPLLLAAAARSGPGAPCAPAHGAARSRVRLGRSSRVLRGPARPGASAGTRRRPDVRGRRATGRRRGGDRARDSVDVARAWQWQSPMMWTRRASESVSEHSVADLRRLLDEVAHDDPALRIELLNALVIEADPWNIDVVVEAATEALAISASATRKGSAGSSRRPLRDPRLRRPGRARSDRCTGNAGRGRRGRDSTATRRWATCTCTPPPSPRPTSARLQPTSRSWPVRAGTSGQLARLLLLSSDLRGDDDAPAVRARRRQGRLRQGVRRHHRRGDPNAFFIWLWSMFRSEFAAGDTSGCVSRR